MGRNPCGGEYTSTVSGPRLPLKDLRPKKTYLAPGKRSNYAFMIPRDEKGELLKGCLVTKARTDIFFLMFMIHIPPVRPQAMAKKERCLKCLESLQSYLSRRMDHKESHREKEGRRGAIIPPNENRKLYFAPVRSQLSQISNLGESKRNQC